MIPSNNNTPAPCNPISSNCVVWQGPDLPCIDLCNGDTISDVVAKLAEKLCEIIDAACSCNPDLTGLDLKCALPAGSVFDPSDIVGTLQYIIDYLCDLINTNASVDSYSLPKCLVYRDDLGNQITALPPVPWATLIGNSICDIVFSVGVLNQNVANIESRVAILEECVLPCRPSLPTEQSVVSTCIFAGETVSVSTLLLALEQSYCKHIGAVGSTGQVGNAVGASGISISSRRLAIAGTVGNIPGWIAAPKTLAETTGNQWRVIDDLYSAVSDIQTKLPKQCDGVSFQFTYNVVDANSDGLVDAINLNFQGTTLPSGFTDCGGSTTVTVTDSNGSFLTENIIVSNLTGSAAGVNIPINELNVLRSLNLSIPFCATDGVSQCSDRQQVIVPLTIPCPALSITGMPSGIQVNFNNILGTDVSYTITATSETTGVVLSTTTINNPGTSVSHAFVGVTGGETYSITVTVDAGMGSRITCPAESVTIPGTVCTNLEVTTPSAAPVSDSDIYLGLYDNGPTITRYWYDATGGGIKAENVGAAVPCDSPVVTNPVMDFGGTPGDVQVTVGYGTEPSPVSAELSWSVDGMTYLGLVSGADGARTISTGQTSGSVYIKVETTCTGPLVSVPTILRYDFATDVWVTIQSPQECAATSLATACPAGVEVSRQYLECGEITYAVFGGAADSYWFYVGKRVDGMVTRYIYAGWDNATQSVRSVVECCVCPTFILSDPIQVLCGHDGDSVTITIPYVLGAGEPDMIILSNPVLGTVVQGSSSNEFVYTAINPSGITDYADTFQVQLQPTVPGTGECSLATSTVQIQYVNSNVRMPYTDSDLYIFINTNGISSVYGGLIQQGILNLTTYWNTEFGYTGNTYFIPTDAKNWLGYPKAIVDDGASWVQSADLSWQAMESLPDTWPGGGGVGVYKNSALVFIFSNDSSGVYHDATLAAGYGSGPTAQPTADYKDDYNAMVDMLTGTQSSLWAQNLNITQNQFPDKLSMVLYPMMVNGSGGVDAATIMQMISAYTAELIPPSKYGISTAVDVTSYILQGVSGTMPYAGATTPANTITQLFEKNDLGMLALLNQEYSAQIFNEIKDGTNAQFTDTLTRAIKSSGDAYPVGTAPATNVFEVQDCAGAWAPFYVRITDHQCGTIGNGTVVKLNNPGATLPASGGRPEWATLTNKCVTIVDNCSGLPDELATDLVASYAACTDCTP